MKTKNIIGLDLGTTSIGFAHVIEGEKPENSSINMLGVRIIPLSIDEQTNFEKGKSVSINADRTLKRGARRILNRYKDRRKNLIEVLRKANVISEETVLTEDGKNTTHETWRLRSKSVLERVEKDQLARIFLAINKKRGYKSSRKSKNEDEGKAIDGMTIAKQLYEQNLTPGQLVYQLLKDGKKYIPDFYRSDLQREFDKVWECQSKFYPEIFTNEFYQELLGKGLKGTSSSFWAKYKFNTAENKGTREEKLIRAYEWRSKAIADKLNKEEAAYVISEINSNINNSSGYLGSISDRSKELYFNKETVGQYLYKQLKQNPHTKLKNQVFYRQDYLDEFEAIWKEQSKHHSELTAVLKTEIRDIIIFYQRRLKSQKDLISLCEFEKKQIQIKKEGKIVETTVGMKVTPKSSPLFQEFKIWQTLNNCLLKRKRKSKNKLSAEIIQNSETEITLDLTAKQVLFDELNVKGNIKSDVAIKLLGYETSEWELNYPELEGNNTNKVLLQAYLEILEIEGYDTKDLLKIKQSKDEIDLSKIDVSANEIRRIVREIFNSLNIKTQILEFDSELKNKEFEQQLSYQLWHLLYSYEGDNSVSGTDKLYKALEDKFGFKKEHAQILANIALQDDYGSLSTKAIRKIFPFIKENKYSEACALAGYKHSAESLTKEEINSRPLKPKLEILKKNSLRNPVVEKILNQMINVVNTLIEVNSKKDEGGKIIKPFHFDEIRIELARELKKSAKERSEMSANIGAAKIQHEKIVKLLQSEFGVKNPSRNDIIRYKLYEELKNNGYKDLYTDTYIPREILFSKQIDIDHIIPQARLFDDSFSNKTVIYRKDNLKKSNRTAFDYIESEYGKSKAEEFLQRIEKLFEVNKKNNIEGIGKAKFLKLQKRESEIGDGFIERDLRDTQYIAKQAKKMLLEITRSVLSTTGSITERLREDWGLVNLMQELNFDKFKKLGLTEKVEKKDGTFKERIIDWNKRNDHRHHAMDALTVAFTKHSHIQYLNNLNARYYESHKEYKNIKHIEEKETHVVKDDSGSNKRVFNLPIPNFRVLAKEQLENVLVSHKAKNKVVTKNKNKIPTSKGVKIKTELTPRGQLHKETVYGKYFYPVQKEEKVSAKFDLETINKVSNPTYKMHLLTRFNENGNDPKKAFSGKNTLSKNPIYLDEKKSEIMPEIVTLSWLESDYSIRKDVTPENFKDDKTIEKVLDAKVRQILSDRLKEFGNDPKKAFSDLDKNPIWLNRDKGISIKRVTISGVSNAQPLHVKKDHFGKEILDKNGNAIPVDFVSTGNNHHVAIYKDEKGILQERVVSFFDAVELINAGLPVIDTEFNKNLGWQFMFTMKQNEYFVFPNEKTGFNPKEFNLLDSKNYKEISPNLFRVQKIATNDYWFRHHLETTVDVNTQLKDIAYRRCSLNGIKEMLKVRINHIGQIVKVGEY
ncbi:MAG: type II CRISPR RNA-guided endonuclease Cas9 [Chryseotalea sp.]